MVLAEFNCRLSSAILDLDLWNNVSNIRNCEVKDVEREESVIWRQRACDRLTRDHQLHDTERRRSWRVSLASCWHVFTGTMPSNPALSLQLLLSTSNSLQRESCKEMLPPAVRTAWAGFSSRWIYTAFPSSNIQPLQILQERDEVEVFYLFSRELARWFWVILRLFEQTVLHHRNEQQCKYSARMDKIWNSWDINPHKVLWSNFKI